MAVSAKEITDRQVNPAYPTRFFSTKYGKFISKNKIKAWLGICRNELLKGKRDFYYIGSGDSMVIAFRFRNGWRFVVAKDCQKFDVPNGEVEGIKF